MRCCIADDLINVIRFILKYPVGYVDQASVFANYAQEMHYCYTYFIVKDLEFVLNGVYHKLNFVVDVLPRAVSSYWNIFGYTLA
ncbi:hypothetical protein HID58_078373 [Brassica napus]|uniref:Uncharacterized protein n=1 Tax=Brassica napus TaxID=3708 RepID=A0ABQ7YTV5_BRANA|nr:hypothetical protein HID58_078373 [Brassica napus]